MPERDYTDAELDAMTDEQLLKAAIADARTRPTYEFELSQIWGGTVQGRSELEEVFVSETAPLNVRATFHLTGEGVHEHSTDATMLADVIGGLAKASGAQAAHMAQQRRQSRQKAAEMPKEYVARPLLATGLGEGSVTFALETAPDGRHPGEDGLTLEPDSDTLDDRAFRTVLDVVASDGHSEALDALNAAARRALLPAADALGQASVDIDITVTQRHRTTQRHAVRTARVRMLTEVLKQPQTESASAEFVAEIDGFKASDHKVFLRKDGTTHAWAVGEPLLRRIRRLAEQESALFDCSGTIERTTTPGKKPEIVRTLAYIDRAKGKPEQQSLDG